MSKDKIIIARAKFRNSIRLILFSSMVIAIVSALIIWDHSIISFISFIGLLLILLFDIFQRIQKLTSDSPEVIITNEDIRFFNTSEYDIVLIKDIKNIHIRLNPKGWTYRLHLQVKDNTLEFDLQYADINSYKLKRLIEDKIKMYR